MKDFVQNKYPDLGKGKQRSEEEIRRIIKEAWDEAVDADELENLIESMPRRIRDVYEANGGPIEY